MSVEKQIVNRRARIVELDEQIAALEAEKDRLAAELRERGADRGSNG